MVEEEEGCSLPSPFEDIQPPQELEQKIRIKNYLIDLYILFWDSGEKRFPQNKRVSIRQCAELWRVSGRTAWQRVKEIEDAGHIVIVRGVGIYLTEKGAEFLEEYKAEQERERYKTHIEQEISQIIDGKRDDIVEIVTKYPEKKSLYIEIPKDTNDEIYDELINRPVDIIKTFETILDNKAVPSVAEKLNLNVRFIFPLYFAKRISEITPDDVNKFVCVKGIVTKVSDVFLKPSIAVYICSDCNAEKKIEQKYDIKPVYPSACDKCKKTGGFKHNEDKSELINIRTMEIQEDIEEGEMETRKIKVYLFDDLASRKISVGVKVFVSGVLKTSIMKNLMYQKYILANNVLIEEKEKIDFKEEDIAKFKEFSKDRPIEKIVSVLAPSIKGLDEVKKAIALQFFSAPHCYTDSDGMGVRFNIHILLIGDPSTGKTHLLLSACDVAHKGLFVSAEGATGRGLTVSLERTNTDFGEIWEVRAGAMVLANGGGLYLDEIDKAVKGKDIMDKLLQGMETGRISIARAGVVGIYSADAYILGAANPKFGRFVPEKSIAEQIDLPPTLLSRFDLIFPICDVIDEKKDEAIAEGILSVFSNGEGEKEDIKPFLKKYISYARTIEVQLPKNIQKTIKDYYLYLRRPSTPQQILITPRQLQAIIRLAVASARARLSNIVEEDDVKEAIKLMEYSLSLIAQDRKSGFFDIDKITIGTKDEREKIRKMSDILEGMLDDKNQCSKEKFIAECITQGLTKNDVLTFISNMIREGRLVEHPKEIIERII